MKSFKIRLGTLLVLLFLSFTNLYSQNAINSALYGNFTHSTSNIIYYCSTDGEDILTGVTPVTGDFVVAAPLYAVNNATNPATARINPSTLPLGDYNIEFNSKVYIARIIAPPVVTLAALPNQCQNGASISLIPYGNPAGGVFSGVGVTGTTFNPSTAGAGSHVISYTYPATGCSSTATQTIVVNAVPVVSLIDFTPVCQGTPAFVLTQGSPAGGTYSGVGVAGGLFDPAVAGVGSHAITYTIVSGTCSASATKNQVVNPLPAVTFSGLNYIVGVSPIPWYCDNGALDNLVGSPLGGSFSGPGISNIIPAGNATFDPKTTGLGEHDITYTYTDLNGCSNSQTQRTRVGTIVYINGLDPAHCQDDPNDDFLVSPYGATSNLFINGIAAPLTPIGGGTFDPDGASSLIGINQVRYEYTDESLCLNRITQSVQVDVSPNVNFTGLNATQQYCFGSADILLTGNYAPNGVFTGDGILDHGNGTATFQPSTLGVGTYSITYTYITALGCNDSETKTVEILPLPNIFSVTGGGARCEVGAGLPIGLSDSEAGFNYQLYRNNVPVIPNVIIAGTGGALNFGNYSTAGTYTVVAIDALTSCTQLMSGSATITVTPKSAIILQPVDATACEDGSATFTIQATGENLIYQWVQDGVNVGISSNVLVLNALPLTADGDDISCTITSTCGDPLLSNTVKLHVNPKTTITTHPLSKNACTGDGVTFSVVASGLNNIYRWEKGGFAVGDVPGKIVGSNTANLSIFNLDAADAGTYICYVDGDCGVEVISNPAVLTIDAPIVITSHPASVTACAGTNISYSIVATGTNLSYQWWFDDAGAVVPVVVGAGSSLAVNAIDASDVGSYYCVVSSPCGATVTSNTATLTIPANTQIPVGGDPVGGSICEGSNFNFSVTATGSMLTYEWFKGASIVPLADNAVIGNSSSANLTLTATPVTYKDNYWVRVTGTCGVVSSAPANLVVYEPISFVFHPASVAVCSGSDASFSVNVTGDVLGYQWQRDIGAGFVIIGGANASSYIQPAALIGDAGSYRCMITTAQCGTFYSNAATLTVNPNTAITVQPESKNSCVGNSVSFSVTATGFGLAYQWYKNAVAPANLIAGATNATLNLSGITAADAGNYICVVTGSCGPAVISNPGTLTVDISPVISTNPQSASVCLNSNHDLTVALSAGSNPVYQWYFNGGPVGANSPIHSILGFNAGDVGNYYVTITNGCGTIISNTAALSLVNSFTITDQPDDVSVCVNGTATFTVAGSQPGLSYQWRKGGADIVGATSASLVIPNVTLADNGSQYTCVVRNSCDVITSNPATLTVTTAAAITQQPLSDVVCVGEKLTLVTVATGSGLTYQWFKNNILIGGAVNPAYTIDPFAAGDVGTYHCVVTNGCGSIKSSDAVITLGTPTLITAQPIALTLCEGNNAVFSTTATGSNLVYEWRKNDTLLVNNGHVVGVNTSSLTISNLLLKDEGTFNVIVKGGCGLQVVSTGAYLDVVAKPVITKDPDPRTACNGADVSFSVTATGDNLTYSWQKGGVDIGETNPNLDILGVTDAEEGIYRCVVSNATCGSVNSTSAELIVEDNASVVVHPVSLTRCEGSNVTFVADVNGPSGMILQWYKGVNPLSNNARINGVTLETLSISNITLADAGDYWLQVTSSCGNTISNTATLTVQQRIVITQQPQDITVCPAGTLNLSVIATGTITNYQWKQNGGDVGVSSSTYTVAPFVAATHAGSYVCELTNVCETVVTDVAVVTPGVKTSVTIVGDVTACEGANANLEVNAAGTNLTYKWYKGTTLLADGARIGGSQTASLTINGLLLSDAGTYKCEVLGTCGFDDDNTPILTVQPKTAITTEPVSTSVLVGNNATFTTTATGSNITYQWYKGAGIIVDGADYSGTDTPVLTVLNADLLDAGTFKCVVNGVCGVVETKPATLTVLTSTVIITQPVTPITICQGNGFTIFIQTSGAGHTYQWKRDADVLADGGGIVGSQTASLTISNAQPNQSGAYTCVVNGVEISSASVVTVNPTTIISTNPVGGTKCEGDTHILSVTATGSNLTYEWFKNNVTTGVSANEYTLGPLAAGDAATYHCVVKGTCGDVPSSGATLTVNSKAIVNGQPPASTIICQTATTSLLFDVSGTGLTYLWKKNGLPITDANISGITTNNLQISAGIPTNSGDFTCTVISLCGGVITSDVARVTVNPSTVITVQPIGRTKCEGDGVVFTVEATGSDLVYDWQLEGTSIGVTAPILSISPLDKATHEGTYRCLVTGYCGSSLLSDPAILTINRNVSIVGAPVISTNPVCENSSTTITINATGDGLTYLWKKNGALITGANVSGQTTNQLVISNATLADAGVYSCTVTGACGTSETSTSINLAVNPNTVIVTQPLSYTKCSGDEVTFTVQAQGNGLVYQWKKGDATGPNVINDARISGATTNVLRITGIIAADAGSYICVITGLCGEVNTTPAVLTVNGVVSVDVQPPALTTVCQGASTEINVTMLGTVASYQWKKNGVSLVNGGNISGVNTSKLVISNSVLTDAGFYSCEITGTCNVVSTISSELRVNPSTVITQHPSSVTLCEGDNAQFFVVVSGVAPLTYQWQFNNVNIAGATSSSLTINGVIPTDAGAYTCIVSGASTCGVITSNPANLAVNPKINIAVPLANVTVCEDNTAIFTVDATGTGALTYKWLFNGNYLVDNGRITGTTTKELKVNLATNSDEGIYKCEIYSLCGNDATNSVTLTVDDSTRIIAHPVSQSILIGASATFNVSATGVGLAYQWRFNGADILGANLSTYVIPAVALANAGQYSCVVKGACGEVVSNVAVLTVNQPVVITAQPIAITRCVGQSASFTVVASGSIVSYQWKFNGANISDGGGVSGANSANLVIASVTAANAGQYSCAITGTNNVANSNTALLTVNQVAAITTQPKSQTKCDGDMLVLEVLPNDPSLTYTWQLNGGALPADPRITGANSSMLVIADVSSADAGSYRCVVSNSCATEISDPAVVSINPVVQITNEPVSVTRCVSQSAFFSVVANIATANYQWYKNGVALSSIGNVSGATSANLIISNLTIADAGNYSCRVFDNCTYDNSIVSTLTIRETTLIQEQPINTVVCEGGVAYFEVKATPVGLTFKWQKNGVDLVDSPGKIEGANTSVLVVRNVDKVADEGVYRCVITGGCNDELTNPASLTVNEFPDAAGTISGLQTICQGTQNVLYVVPEIANATTYIWDVPYGGTIVGGIGSRTIQVNYSNTALSGVVTVYGQNGCGNGAQSVPLPVTVNPLPTAYAGVDQVICSSTVQLDGNNVAGGTWSIFSGDGVIVNPNLYNTTVDNLLSGINKFVRTVTQSGCSASDTVSVNNLKVSVNAGTDQVICSKNGQFNAIIPVSGASWTVVNGYGTIETPSSPTSRVIGLNQGTNTFAWQVNNSGCISADQVSITNNAPFPPEAGPDQIVAFDATDLNADIPEIGTTGFWQLISGGGVFTNPTDPKTRVSSLMPGTNILVWTVKREACILTDTITVENILVEPAEAGTSQTLCVDHTTLNATRPPIGTGEWSVILGQATFDDKFKPNAKVTNLGHDINVLRWTVRTSILGVTWDEVTIINNSPTPANAGPDMVLCIDQVNLAANLPVYGIGTWTLNSGAGDIANINQFNSLITDLGPGKNELKWTIDYNGCISEDFVAITNNTPTTALAGDDQVICYDSTLLLPNTPTYGVGTWSVESGRGIFKGNTVTQLASGLNTFIYTITNGTCKSFDKVDVINNKPTTPNAGYDRSICVDNTQLSANFDAIGDGAWTIINGSGTFSSLTVNNPTVTNLAFGDNIFRWTITNNGCTEHDEVIIANNFILATAGEDETLCQDSITLKASNPLPGIGTWTILEASAALFENQNAPNSKVRNLSKGANSFRWTVSNKGCVSYDDVIITNNEPTRALAGENQSVCSKSANLFANDALYGTGVWTAMSGAAVFADPSNPRTSVNNLAGGPNILRWTITKESCVSFDEVIITSNLATNVFAGNNQIACSDTAVLSANPPSLGTGQWSIISGAGSFNNRYLFNTTVRNLGQGDNVFRWTVSNSDCHVSDTVVIRSSIPTRSIAGANQILCSDSTVLGGNTPSNGAGTWTIVSGSVQFANANTPNTKVFNIARGNNILAWVIDKDGCQSTSEMTITNNQPTTPFAGYDRDLCGDSIRLFADPPAIGVGYWTLVSGDANILNPNDNQARVVNIKFGPNTFRWTVTNKNCVMSDDVVITSNYSFVNAGADFEVNAPTAQLIGNKPPIGIGTWTLSAGQGTILDPSSFETWVNGLGSGSNVFEWSVNYNGCVATDAVTVNYVVWPTADFEPSVLIGCSPLEVNFVNTSIGGAPYSWDFGDGNTSNQPNIIHTFQDPGVYNVKLTATAPLGNIVVTQKKITVHGHPTASFDIAPKEVYVPGQHISCYNYSVHADTSHWDFGDGRGVVTKFAPTYTYSDTGVFDITLKVVNAYGCVDSMTIADAIHVIKRSGFFFPEAFTPNPLGANGGDYSLQPFTRSNDVLYPILVDGDITDYELKIFNRMGVLIFKSNNLLIGWDGYYQNKIQPQDVYVYKVSGRYNSGERFEKVGNVLLLRVEN